MADGMATAIVNGSGKVVVGSSVAMLDQILNGLSKAAVNGNLLDFWFKARLAFTGVGYVFKFMGGPLFLQLLKEYVSFWQIAGAIATMTLSIIAFVATGGQSVWVEAVLLGIQIAFFADTLVDFLPVCFPKMCHMRALEEIDCDDGNPCTSDTSECIAGDYVCVNSYIDCSPGFSCDLRDGSCKPDNQLVPCVAVIDEDDSFGGNQEEMWATFRQQYPARPFCLLVPNPQGSVAIPANFLSDPLAIVYFDIARDNGDKNLAVDWFTMCGLNLYGNQGAVDWVGLFIDDSGSLNEYEVSASKEMFESNLAAIGVSVNQVVNADENWILPFLTELVPSA
jgi:hypothetical protein